MNNYPNSPKEPQKNYTLQLIVYWLIVGVPLAWGIYKTLMTTINLFQMGLP